MLLPLSAAAIMAAVLLWELALPRLRGSLPQLARELAARRWRATQPTEAGGRSPPASIPVSAGRATTPAASCAPSSAPASCCARA